MSHEPPVVLQADLKLGETRPLRSELRRRGAIVRMAETLDQTIREADRKAPDLVYLDDDLGRGESFDLVEYFRSGFPDAEVVLLSSKPEHLSGDVGMGLLFHGLQPVATETLLELAEQALEGRLAPASHPAEPAPLVLCVDDELPALKGLSRLLLRHGYRVATFDHPENVLGAIAEVGPDLVLLDVAMPGMNGRELAQQIRSRYQGKFPIVMHSARRSDADRWSGFRHGADYYLPKPCEPHQLLDVVDYYADRLDPEERQFIESRL